MADRFVRSEAGRREIRERQANLSRAARNLLLIIDASRSGGEWLAMVAGCTAADLQQLIDAGLITAAGGAAATGAVAVGAAEPVRTARTLEQALQARGYRELYELLTQQARPRLGLVKGYKMVLEVEKCNGPDEIRALALRFVDLVRAVQGEDEAQALRRQLGAES
jgi:hypothetical protein